MTRSSTPIRDGSTSTPQPVIHYVQPGQTLWEIAQQYYDDGEQWRVIAQANPKIVGSNGGIRVGVRLEVPNIASLPNPARRVTDSGDSATGSIGNRSDHETRRDNSARPDPDQSVTVNPGDSLSRIAEEHLGSADRWSDLFEANKDRLKSPDHLIAGMKLRLPSSDTRAEGSDDRGRSRDGSGTSGGAGDTYTVSSGDTLSSIAQRQLNDRERWRDIFELNRDSLDTANDIYVGQRLKLPNR